MTKPCASIECAPSDTATLERVRYFAGQLLTPDDMRLEEEYFRHRLRRHNRFLHGWGVVCGARVKPHPESKPWTVIIEPGYVLDPHGNEILIDQEVEVDVRCEEDPCAHQLDPWCSDVRTERQPGRPLYIAVCYEECMARPVRVQMKGCGCDDAECEYSRVRDSFKVKVLIEPPYGFPCCRLRPRLQDSPFFCPPSGIRNCPPCPPDPCVGLATVFPQDRNGNVAVDNGGRRHAITFANQSLCCPTRALGGRTTQRVIAYPSTEVVSLADPEDIPPDTSPFLWRTLTGDRILFPLTIEVPPEGSAESLLEAEGDREFYHPAAGGTFTLRNLFAAAGVQPEEKIESREALLRRLESEPIDLGGYLSTRDMLAELIVPEARQEIDRRGAKLETLASDLKAKDISGVTPDSPVAKAVGESTIAAISRQSRNTFVKKALSGVPADQRMSVEAEAQLVWNRAKRFEGLTGGPLKTRG